MSWAVAQAANSGPTLPGRKPDDVPVRELACPTIVPVMRAFATPSTTSLSFARLPGVRVLNLNNHDEAVVRLYDVDGSLNRDALAQLRRLLGDVSKPDAPVYADLDPRPIQLMMRAAYHFRAREVVVVSGYRAMRKRHEGFHARGLAVDFQIPSVPLTTLAAYLHTLARVGVGLYTHPKTQWVHLDSRVHSYHWADSSGPGQPGGPWPVGDSSVRARQDRQYRPSDDWPEGTVPSAAVVAERICKWVTTPREADEP